MGKKNKKYYDLDADSYLEEDYYDSLASGKVNKLSGFIHTKRFEKIDKIVRLHLRKNDVLVDFGCGNCSWNKKALPVVGVDYSKRMLDYSIKKKRIIKAIQADITKKTSLKTASVDILVITETLEHFLNPGIILKEIHRVLKPSGIVIVSVPYDTNLSLWKPLFALLCFYKGTIRRSQLYRNKCGHVQNFSPESLARLLKRNNFKLKYVDDVFRFTQFAVAEKK